MRRIICLITACLIIAAVFSGCGILQKLGLQNKDTDELHPVSSVVMGEDEAKQLSDKVPVHLYFANGDSTKLVKEIRYIPLAEVKKSTGNLASILVKELIDGPAEGSSLQVTIPKEAKLRSPVTINAGVATVDFTSAFIDKHPGGGKSAEQMTIFSIVNTLTELKEIQKVKFLINGKARSKFLGNFQFDAPFARSHSLISKESVVPGPANTEQSKGTGGKDGTKEEKTKGGEGQKAPDSKGSADKSAETSGGAEGDSEETYIELEEEEILE